MKAIHLLASPRFEVFHLEEWLLHHLHLGIDKFYIYNTGEPYYNTKPEWRISDSGIYTRHIVERCEKSDDETLSTIYIDEIWQHILRKYAKYIREEKVKRIVNGNQNTYYSIQQKYNILRNPIYIQDRVSWIANIDGDELIQGNLSFLDQLGSNIGQVKLPQICYQERFNDFIPYSFFELNKTPPMLDKLFYTCHKNFVKPIAVKDWQNVHYGIILNDEYKSIDGNKNLFFHHFRGHGYKETAKVIQE